MKKILTIVLAGLLLVGLAGCSGALHNSKTCNVTGLEISGFADSMNGKKIMLNGSWREWADWNEANSSTITANKASFTLSEEFITSDAIQVLCVYYPTAIGTWDDAVKYVATVGGSDNASISNPGDGVSYTIKGVISSDTSGSAIAWTLSAN